MLFEVKMKPIVKSSCIFIVVLLQSIVLVQSDIADVDAHSKVRPGWSKTEVGDVFGARSCGGEGKFIQWRLEECKTTNSTCIYPADGQTHHCEFTFIPSQNVEQLGLRMISSVIGSKSLEVEEHILQNSTVVGGIEQTIHLNGRVSEEHKGKMMTTQCIFYRVADQGVEMCAEADFIMV